MKFLLSALLAFALLIAFVAPGFAADKPCPCPPGCTCPCAVKAKVSLGEDPPDLRARVASLENRVAQLESLLSVRGPAPTAIRSEAPAETVIRTFSSSGTTCTGPGCQQSASVGQTGWYPGKNLGRPDPRK